MPELTEAENVMHGYVLRAEHLEATATSSRIVKRRTNKSWRPRTHGIPDRNIVHCDSFRRALNSPTPCYPCPRNVSEAKIASRVPMHRAHNSGLWNRQNPLNIHVLPLRQWFTGLAEAELRSKESPSTFQNLFLQPRYTWRAELHKDPDLTLASSRGHLRPIVLSDPPLAVDGRLTTHARRGDSLPIALVHHISASEDTLDVRHRMLCPRPRTTSTRREQQPRQQHSGQGDHE